MRAYFLIPFIVLSFTFASADADCEKALAQAKKTCKADHNCAVQYMTVSGFDVVYTSSSINCRGSKSGAVDSDKESYLKPQDRELKKPEKEEKRKSVEFDFE